MLPTLSLATSMSLGQAYAAPIYQAPSFAQQFQMASVASLPKQDATPRHSVLLHRPKNPLSVNAPRHSWQPQPKNHTPFNPFPLFAMAALTAGSLTEIRRILNYLSMEHNTTLVALDTGQEANHMGIDKLKKRYQRFWGDVLELLGEIRYREGMTKEYYERLIQELKEQDFMRNWPKDESYQKILDFGDLDVWYDCLILGGMEMTLIPEGTFTLFSEPDVDVHGYDWDGPQPIENVHVDSFYMGKIPVTEGQFKEYLDDIGDEVYAETAIDPETGQQYVLARGTSENGPMREVRIFGYDGPRENLTRWPRFRIVPERAAISNNGDNLPLLGIHWIQAVSFAAWKSDKTGRFFRLPTEAEWEWAAKTDQTGLYDMVSMVWEWAATAYAFDSYDPSDRDNPWGPNETEMRILRGGFQPHLGSRYFADSYGSYIDSPHDIYNNFGFRLVMIPQGSK